MNYQGFDNIVDFLQMKLQELPLQPHGIIYREAAEYLASALSSASIGDVKKAEHRAEVAERALEILNDYECLSNPIRYYMKQAEKELQEEK